jgi:carbazole 1,9a-dioxygenase terminal dioxygenase component
VTEQIQLTAQEFQAEAEVERAQASKPWQSYLDAALGFRNHWYPAVFSHEVEEGGALGVRLLGEPVLLKRVGGQVYAVQDRCLHRGVPFSARPECYSRNTITCWYHGFTYDVRDGKLVAIITDPDSALIGKLSLRTYPVEEHKGLVFVFIGDMDPPPPLFLDVQPGMLDEKMALVPKGERTLVHSNWRLAAENGFDASHIYIHRNSPLVIARGMPMPLATLFHSREGMVVVEEGKPKGVVKGSGRRSPIWEAQIEDQKVTSRIVPTPDGPRRVSPDTSMWMPCGLKVDPFPTPGMIQFEWYVPVDEKSHSYIVTWGKYVESDEEAQRFYQDAYTVWKDLVVNTFNNDDVVAREAMERFYGEEDGWHRERLYRPDLIITEWRKLASAHNRGIQRRPTV